MELLKWSGGGKCSWIFEQKQNKQKKTIVHIIIFYSGFFRTSKSFALSPFTHRQRGPVAAVISCGCGGRRGEGRGQRGEGWGQGRVAAAPDQEGRVWEETGRSQKVQGQKSWHFPWNVLQGLKEVKLIRVFLSMRACHQAWCDHSHFSAINRHTNILDIIFVPYYLSTKIISKRYLIVCYRRKTLTIVYI